MTVPLKERRKVFVRGLNWIGDAIMSTPALTLLRHAFKDSHITLMARPWVAPIYENNPDIDELWVEDDAASFKEFRRVAKRIRDAEFDLGIALPNSLRSALLMWLGQIKHRIGYARGNRSLLLTRSVKVDKELLEKHEVRYYLNLVEWLADEPAGASELVLNPGAAEQARARARLRELQIPEGKLLIAVAPGAINSEAKMWLPERFAELSDRLKLEAKAEVFLVGSEREASILNDVEERCEEKVHNLAGALGLAEAIAFMNEMHGFIGNDSGGMHIAAALDVPTVAIFGPTNHKTTSPFSPVAKIVRHPVDCAPCMLRECPIEHPCMTGISVNDVLRKFAELADPVRERMRARKTG